MVSGEGREMARIVVGIDGSPGSDDALRWAVREAQLRSAEIELVHAYVVEAQRAPLVAAHRDLADHTVQQVIDRHRNLLDKVKWSSRLVPLLSSSFSGALVRAGEDADLSVVGSRGIGGFNELLMGSTSYRTAAHATCPVAVVRGAEQSLATTIEVGVDDSRSARGALQWALDEAALRSGGVTVVHGYFVPDPVLASGIYASGQLERVQGEARDEAHALVDRLLGLVDVPAGVAVERIVAAGSPAQALLRETTTPRLTVVGTTGRGAMGRAVMGSVSHQVLHHAGWPVVVVP